jgi:hypothetical protein
MTSAVQHLQPSMIRRVGELCLVCGNPLAYGDRFTGDPDWWNRYTDRCDTTIVVAAVDKKEDAIDPSAVVHHTVQGRDGPCLCCDTELVTVGMKRTGDRSVYDHDYYRCDAIQYVIASITTEPT